MQTIGYKEFKEMMDSGQITPYNVYNLDVDYPQSYSVKNYIENESDTIDQDQKLNKAFLDIELFTNNEANISNIMNANHAINAITVYSTFEKIYYAYILLFNENITHFPVDDLQTLNKNYYEILLKDDYIEHDDEINVKYFTYETDLIKAIWNDIHKIDPAILSGWYSDHFDYPYIYNRLNNLLQDVNQTQKIMSKFGSIKQQKMGESFIIKIPDYPILDLLHLYKPREEGGMNYGKKQPSYSLDWISDYHLKRKKLKYKDDGSTLDTFFINDPVNFLLYNIMDVSLCVGLDKKLKHIDNHNVYRRLMKTPLDSSIRGSSVLFDTFVLYELSKKNKYVRFAINEENTFDIPKNEIDQIPTPISKKKINWNTKVIENSEVKRVSSTFPGAYVKDSPGKLYTSEDGMIIGLDATSLYPSMILQHNISFDSFFGRIIDPIVYKTLQFIKQNQNNPQVISQLANNILQFVVDYVEKTEPANKNTAYQQNYYVTIYAIKKLLNDCNDFDSLLNPPDFKHYIMLKKYLMLLIDMMEKIHVNANEYNNFCYDLFINDSEKYKNTDIYIIENFYSPTIRINKINQADFHNYIKQNNLIVTLSGALFYQHDVKMGLFSDWLELMASRRKEFKSLRDKFETEKGSSCDEAAFYEMTQKAVKIAMNTSYGLYGLTTFRYSNSHLAKAITTQGRYVLKICQQISDMYIDHYQNK